MIIKYVKERYSDPNQTQIQLTTANPQKQINQVNQSTVALRNLKQTQDHLDSMKRRLSVLQIKQDKYNRRVSENQRKLNFHALVQQSANQEKKRKMKYRKKMQKQLQKSRSRIKQQNQMHEKQYQAVKQDLSASKRAEYERVKATRQLIEKSIQQMKEQDHHQKLSRKNQIRQMQKKQKQHIAEYFFSKRNNFRESSVREGSRYQSRRSQRQKMLLQLSQMQSKLLYNQSASRAALEDSYRKLQKITVKPTLNTRSTRQKSTQILSQRLPQIGNKNQDDFLLI